MLNGSHIRAIQDCLAWSFEFLDLYKKSKKQMHKGFGVRWLNNLLVIAQPVFQALKILDKEKEKEKKITEKNPMFTGASNLLVIAQPIFQALFCCDHNILLFFPRPVGTDFLCNPDFFWLSEKNPMFLVVSAELKSDLVLLKFVFLLILFFTDKIGTIRAQYTILRTICGKKKKKKKTCAKRLQIKNPNKKHHNKLFLKIGQEMNMYLLKCLWISIVILEENKA
ncbi:hypothetical protein ACJX0J_008922 [Zea mays]